MKKIEKALEWLEEIILTTDGNMQIVCSARAELEELRERLRGIEHKFCDLYMWNCCNSPIAVGHKDDCWLKAIIGGD